MIKAEEARKVTAEALEAHKKKQSLEESRRLKKLFEQRMADTDKAVRAAMKQGKDDCKLEWDHDDMPQALRERFEGAIVDAGFGIEFHANDGGDGWEIIVNWKGK